MKSILVIGGYGQVGRYITEILEKKYNRQVIIGGRDINKANRLKSEKNLHCQFRKMDVCQINSQDFDEIDTVVMCLENNNKNVFLRCLERGINYVDISPSYSILSEINKYKSDIEQAQISVLLGVGIAPGISNLLAKKSLEYLDEVYEINSYLMLGVGEKHGSDAVKWLVNQLNSIYETDGGNGKIKVKSFTDNRKLSVSEKKEQTFTRIDLADSNIMRNSFDNCKINSYFAYDVDLFTKLVCIMKKLGLFHFLYMNWMRTFYQHLFEFSMNMSRRFRLGSDKYSVIVKARGQKTKALKEKDITLKISGNNNSLITAQVAALGVIKLVDTGSGLYFCENILDIDQLEIRYEVCV